MPPEMSYRRHVDEALRILDGRWVVAVLAALAARPLHYSDILTAINDAEARDTTVATRARLAPKVLTETLQRMQNNELIIRHDENRAFTSAVWYELTPMARELLQSLRPIAEWARRHEEALAVSRAAAKVRSPKNRPTSP